MRVTFLIFTFSFLLFADPAESFRTRVAPIFFMSYYNAYRNAALLETGVRSDQITAQETVKLNHTLFEMDSQLYKKKAISEEQLERSKLRKNLSIAQEHQLGRRGDVLSATSELNWMQAQKLKGVAMELKKVYDTYAKQWNSECNLFTANAELAEARLSYNKYILNIDNKLTPGKVVTKEQLLQDRRDVFAAEKELATQRELVRTCLERIPTFEEVQGVASVQ